MKKILGIIFCFVFLLMSGMAFSQSTEVQKPTKVEHASCVVCESFTIEQIAESVNVSQGIHRQSFCFVDAYKVQSDIKQTTHKVKDALFNRYSLVPQCPVIYLGKRGAKYQNNYRYASPELYNQPPNFNI